MTDLFYSRPSLNVELYAGRTAALPVVEGDVEFYLQLARAAPGPALELGCGTGRIVLPLARAGIKCNWARPVSGDARRRRRAPHEKGR